mmetsp:Transcript_10019/g.24931  ORF Transcript_10019/g.24931 Transcript_10019/m.24931 type:complete len:205 (+) Transcript_10019:711-1325(+)
MEVNVVELDHAVAALAHARDREVVVEGEVQLGLAAQVALHLYAAIDREGAHLAVRVEGGGDAIDHVDEDLVLARSHLAQGDRLLHRLGAHRLRSRLEGVSQRARWARLADRGRLVEHARLQLSSGGALGVAVVEDLVHQLVDEGEVLAQRLLRQHADVVLAHLRELSEELDDEGGRHVEDGGGQEEDAVLAHADVGHAVHDEHW